MPAPPSRSGWLSRNADLFAVAAIVLFTGIGSLASHAINRPVLMLNSDSVADTIRPQVQEIRDETRQAGVEAREEVLRQREELRQQCLQVRQSLNELHGQSLCLRDEARRLQTELRDHLRSVFRRPVRAHFE